MDGTLRDLLITQVEDVLRSDPQLSGVPTRARMIADELLPQLEQLILDVVMSHPETTEEVRAFLALERTA